MVEARQLTGRAGRLGFICGMPRSGTTWLGRVLANHPEIATFGETDFWARDFVEPPDGGVYDAATLQKVLRIQVSKDWQATTGDAQPLPGLVDGEYAQLVNLAICDVASGSIPPDPAAVFKAIAGKVAHATGKPILVEKTPGHLLCLERLRAAFPDAPMVVMSREPLGFMASLGNRRIGRAFAANRWIRRLGYHPAITAIMWRAYARSLIAAIDARHPNVLRIDYEDLARDPAGVARRAARQFGASDTSWGIDTDATNSSFPGDRRHAAPAAASLWLRWLARAECRRLYPHVALQRPSWGVVAGSLIALPFAILLFCCFYRPKPTAPWRYLQVVLRGNKVGRAK